MSNPIFLNRQKFNLGARLLTVFAFMILSLKVFAQPAVSKVVDVPTIQSGECVSYTLTFECSKLVGQCERVTLADVVPAGFTYQVATPPPTSITGTGTGMPGDSLIWDLGDVPAGESSQIQATFCSDPGVFSSTTEVTNTIEAVYDENITLSDLEPVTVTSEPDWTISKAQTSGPIYHNKPIDYTLTIDNPSGIEGTQNLDGATVMDVLPPGAVFVSATNSGTYDGTKITWNLGDLLVTGSFPIELDYVITFPSSDPLNNTDAGPAAKTNMAMLGGTDQDGNPYSVSDEATGNILPPNFEVSGSKAAGDNDILVQDSTNAFTITYANEGTTHLEDLVVTDTIPAQFALVDLSVGGCNNPTDSTDISVVLSISNRGSDVISRTVTLPITNDGPASSAIDLFVSPIGLDTMTEWVQVVQLTHGPGAVPEGFGPCSMVLTVTDALIPDPSSSTGFVDNAGMEDDYCIPYKNTVHVTSQQRVVDLPMNATPQEITAMGMDFMTIVPRDARLDPKKSIEIDEANQTLPDGGTTTGNPYVRNLLVKYCVTLANNNRGFQSIVDPLGVDVLPEGLTYEAGETPVLGYLIENDNTGRYIADPSLITFTVENDMPSTGETRLSWRLMDELAPGESVQVCFYARIDETAPSGATLTNKYCLNGDNQGLFCDENPMGKPNNITDADCDPVDFLTAADILQHEDMCCKEVTITVADSLAAPTNTKVVSTPGPYFPFDTVCYQVVVGNDVMANSTFPDPFLLDVLSDKVTFLGDYTITSNDTGLSLDDMGTNPTFVQDVTPNGETTLRWMFDGEFPIDTEVTIEYCVQVNASQSGEVENTTYVYTQNQDIECSTGTFIDTEDYMGNGPGIVDTICGGVEANLTLSSAAKLSSIKFVKGECDTVFTKVPDMGATVPGGTLEYLIEIVNVGNIAFEDLRLIDILPHIGDTGVRLNIFPRETEWEPELIMDVTQVLGDPVQEIAYSVAQDPCREADGIVNADNATCNNANWNPSAAALGGFGEVSSFRIDFSNQVVDPLDTFQFIVTMEAPIGALGFAYNSFAWAGERADNGNTLAAEPNKVCVFIKQDTIGDYVWIDDDMDGIQDIGEMPLEGVPMALFDEDGNLLAYTTTDANGFYQFTSVLDTDQTWVGDGLPLVVSPEDNYYVVAGYDPTAMEGINNGPAINVGGDPYVLTQADAGGDDAVDSDGSVAGSDGAMTPAWLDGLIYEPHFSDEAVADLTLDFGFFPGGYDVALSKVIDLTATTFPLSYGDPVTFTITVTNQGILPVDSIEVTDYIPDGFAYMAGDNTPEWDVVGNVATTVLADDLAPMAMVSTSIVLRLQPAANMDYTNVAEISAIQDTNGGDVSAADVDSQLDNDPDNNIGGEPGSDADNDIGGDGTGTVGDGVAATDADNSDPAFVSIFDLAITKTVDPVSLAAAGNMFDNGEDIIFLIDLTNQGNEVMQNVVVKDTLPCGLRFVNSMNMDPLGDGVAWVPNVLPATDTRSATYTVAEILPGETIQIPIVLRVRTSANVTAACTANPTVIPGQPFTNFSFIESATDTLGNDIPSDVDSDFGSFTAEEAATMPNTNGDNNTSSTGNGEEGSQDDNDPANLEVFDLALSKIISPLELPYTVGDIVTFEICVTSQGNVPTDSVNIIDYIPAGLEYNIASDALGWVGMVGSSTATYAFDDSEIPGGTLTFGEQVCTDIVLTVLAGGTDFVNSSEITSATTIVDDGMGGMITSLVTSDNDSDFDSIPGDEAGGAPETESDATTSDPTDPAILGDGSGMPGDETAATDDDSADPALVPIVDFALRKTLAPDNTTPYAVGDTVTFLIEVINQGNVDGANITINDYIPANLAFADNATNANWTGATAGQSDVTAMMMILGPVVAGEIDSTYIDLIIMAGGVDNEDYTNNAEIGQVFAAPGGPAGIAAGANITSFDIDSTPDANDTNDDGADASSADSPDMPNAADDYIDGNGMAGGDPDDGVQATDEDDADPALVAFHDVALTKTVPAGAYNVGATVPYEITIHNQGNQTVDSIKITDYIRAGYNFTPNNGWVANGSNACLTATVGNGLIPAPGIAPQGNITFTLELVVAPGANLENLLNIAEITGSGDVAGLDQDDDVDSTADDIPDNDAGGAVGTASDNVVDGDGSGDLEGEDPLTDEDDQDPAIIQLFDLAVAIEDATNTITMYGEDIVFPIILENQGNVAAVMPELTVTVPAGFSFDMGANPGWEDNMDGTVTYTYPGTLDAETAATDISLVLTSQPATGADAWTPIIEISADNPAVPGLTDIDSSPNTNPLDDAGGNPGPDTNDDPTGAIGSDDALDGDGTGAAGDTNPATDEDDHDPEFVRIMDVAQTKMIIIETYNQGNLDLVNVEISDYVPMGFTFASDINTGWTGVDGPGDQTATYTIPDTILGGTSVTDTINLILTMTAGGDDFYTNVSEVSFAQDLFGNDTDGNGPNGGLTDVDSDINNDRIAMT